MEKQFIAFFYFVAWDCVSLGLHVSFKNPNIEIHLPFGFIRIGWVDVCVDMPEVYAATRRRTFGLAERFN